MTSASVPCGAAAERTSAGANPVRATAATFGRAASALRASSGAVPEPGIARTSALVPAMRSARSWRYPDISPIATTRDAAPSATPKRARSDTVFGSPRLEPARKRFARNAGTRTGLILDARPLARRDHGVSLRDRPSPLRRAGTRT